MTLCLSDVIMSCDEPESFLDVFNDVIKISVITEFSKPVEMSDTEII